MFSGKRKEAPSSSSTSTTTKKVKPSTTPLRQAGTGLHLDSWPNNLWGKLKKNYTYEKLDRFRPFQSMLCLSDGDSDAKLAEGGLELIPGFASIAEDYMKATDVKFRQQSMRKKKPWVSPYHVKFDLEEDKTLLELIRKVKRVPANWELKENKAPDIDPDADIVDQYLDYLKVIVKEHDKIPYQPVKRGDYIYFDIRMPHQNSKQNYMGYPRCVFYHAYEMVHDCNRHTIESLKMKRTTFEHPDDFSNEFSMEKKLMDPTNEEELIPLTPLGQCLFNEQSYDELLAKKEESEQSLLDEIFQKHGNKLTRRHLDFFHRYGYVVVENMISTKECNQLLKELGKYSSQSNCNLPVQSIIKKENLKSKLSKEEFKKISGPFGGMIEFYYLPTQQKLRIDETLYASTVKLVANTWCSQLDISKPFQESNPPHWKYKCPLDSELDPRKLWTYIDRMNFRFPNKLKK